MRNTKFGRSGLGTVSSPSAEEETVGPGPLSASSDPGRDSRNLAPPVATAMDEESDVSDEADPVTMPIVPSAPPPSDVLSALSAPLPPLPPPPVRREESGRISERHPLGVATAVQIAPDEATRPFPNTEAELRAELMRVRTEAANALSAAEGRLAAAARAMNTHKDPARRSTLADQAELQKRASRLAAELLEARTERDDVRHALETLRGDLDEMEAARDVLEAAIEARDMRGQMAEGRAAALEHRAAAADAALFRARANAEALESSNAEARAQKDALESTLATV